MARDEDENDSKGGCQKCFELVLCCWLCGFATQSIGELAGAARIFVGESAGGAHHPVVIVKPSGRGEAAFAILSPPPSPPATPSEMQR